MKKESRSRATSREYLYLCCASAINVLRNSQCAQEFQEFQAATRQNPQRKKTGAEDRNARAPPSPLRVCPAVVKERNLFSKLPHKATAMMKSVAGDSLLSLVTILSAGMVGTVIISDKCADCDVRQDR